MSSPAIIAAKTEIAAALEISEPKIRGFEDLTHVSLSENALAALRQELTSDTRRRDLCRQAIAALEALEADGYPVTRRTPLPQALFDELQGQLSDVAAAIDDFELEGPALNLAIDLGDPVSK